MKFSKVDKIRHISKNSNEAIFYNNETMKEVDISKQIIHRVDNAKKLYSLFNEKRISQDVRRKNPSIEGEIRELNKKVKRFLSGESKCLDLKINGENPEFIDSILSTTNRVMSSHSDSIKALLYGQVTEKDCLEFVADLKQHYSRETTIGNVERSLKKTGLSVKIDNGEFKLNNPMDDFLKNYSSDDAALSKLFETLENKYFGKIIKGNSTTFLPPNNDGMLADRYAAVITDYRRKAIEGLKGLSAVNAKAEKFWINKIYTLLIAEFTHRKYKTKDSKVIYESYDQVSKFLRGRIKNLIINQYLNLGKAVFHFYDFDALSIQKEDISSFDYQLIKARDTMCQKTHTSVLLAIHSFLSSIKGGGARADVDNNDISNLTGNDLKQLLRYWGGESNCKQTMVEVNKLASEINKGLFKIRNSTFHYNNENQASSSMVYDNLLNLYQQEMNQLKQVILKKYSSNNVFLFYEKNDIKELIEEIYASNSEKPTFIPSYKNVYSKKKHGSAEGIFNKERAKSTEKDVFNATTYFICKEIYYKQFILASDGIKYVKQAIKELDVKYQRKEKQPWLNFKRTIKGKNSLAIICETIIREYADTNTKNTNTGAKNQHYKIILNQVILKAFEDFIRAKYDFLFVLQANEVAEGNEDIESLKHSISINVQNNLIDGFEEWYALAKFISPCELNQLKGSLLKALQFRDSTLRIQKKFGNSEYMNSRFYRNQIEPYFEGIEKILNILEFVQMFSGRINSISDEKYVDYYKDKDEYARVIADFVDYQNPSFDSLKTFDSRRIYADEKNPIIHATIENARMYGSYDFLKKVFEKNKVSTNTYNEYSIFLDSSDYREFVVKVQDEIKTSCELKKYLEIERKAVHFENRIKLYNVSKANDLVMDLYSQLISWMYKWERDRVYFLLGIMYFRCQNDNENTSKILLQKLNNCTVYGVSVDGKGNNTQTIGEKSKCFIDKHMKKREQVRDLFFDNNAKAQNIISNRNDIDHFDMFKGESSKSILEYYSSMRETFAYDKKVKNDISRRLENILKEYFVGIKLEMIKAPKQGKFNVVDIYNIPLTIKNKALKFEDSKTYYLNSEQFKEIVNNILTQK